MNNVFTSPKRLFRINIPEEWKCIDSAQDPELDISRFSLENGAVLELSCLEIDEMTQHVIDHRGYRSHQIDFANFTCYETYDDSEEYSSMIWSSPVGKYFFGARILRLVTHGEILEREISMIRMILQTVSFNPEKFEILKPSAHVEKDLSDIDHWKMPLSKYREYLLKMDDFKTKFVTPIQIDALKLYALLVTKISLQPNGFYSLTRSGKPLDNFVWWDFALECDKGFIQILRTTHVIEAIVYFESEEFNVEKFFIDNIEKYKFEISETIKSFERHQVYINHFVSYRDCVEQLWQDVKDIDITLPYSPVTHASDKKSMEAYVSEIKKFTKNSVRFHTLGKSLVLNAAFKIESFINLYVRVCAKPELRAYPQILDNFFKKSDLRHRLTNLKFYTGSLSQTPDLDHDVIKNALKLMTLRNKYVHGDETSELNQLGVVLFDQDYPLHPTSENRPAVEGFKQTFHVPDLATIKNSYETSNNFIEYFRQITVPDVSDTIFQILESNPVSFNEFKGVYSKTYTSTILDFFGIVDLQ